jgi:hypothetical protein
MVHGDGTGYRHNNVNGSDHMEPAEIHEQKARSAFFEADRLLELGCFDGAVSRAAAGVLQTAKSIMALIPNERDPEEIPACINRMTRDGRIEGTLMSPFAAVMRLRAEADESSFEADKDRAEQAIAYARKVAHLLGSSAAITRSVRSPEVRAAMKARGMKLPVFP